MSQGGTLSLDEREKAACAWFFITWEAALPFTPGVAREVQFGVSPLWELPRLQFMCGCCGSHQAVIKVGNVCGRT